MIAKALVLILILLAATGLGIVSYYFVTLIAYKAPAYEDTASTPTYEDAGLHAIEYSATPGGIYSLTMRFVDCNGDVSDYLVSTKASYDCNVDELNENAHWIIFNDEHRSSIVPRTESAVLKNEQAGICEIEYVTRDDGDCYLLVAFQDDNGEITHNLIPVAYCAPDDIKALNLSLQDGLWFDEYGNIGSLRLARGHVDPIY